MVEAMEVLLQRVAFRLRVAPMAFQNGVVTSPKGMSSGSGWFLKLPEIVNAGNPVLHQKAQQVEPSEIKSQKVQNIIDMMIRVMRNATGVGLAAPQIGIPLRVSIYLCIIYHLCMWASMCMYVRFIRLVWF